MSTVPERYDPYEDRRDEEPPEPFCDYCLRDGHTYRTCSERAAIIDWLDRAE